MQNFKKNKDPTQKFESKHISLLKELKESVAIKAKKYWKIYSTVSDVPKFCGLVKVHKTGAPLRPIVWRIRSMTYELVRVVADI